MRPLQTSFRASAICQFVKMAFAICGRELPSTERIRSMLRDCNAIELRLIPKDPEPGLDSIRVAKIDLGDLPPCQ